MLGRSVADPLGIEGKPSRVSGLGLMDLDTELTSAKRLANVAGRCCFADAEVSGYEIHMGVSRGAALKNPAFEIAGRPEGAISADNQILGTYLHGVFDHSQACAALLQWAGLEQAQGVDQAALREASLERLADTCRPLLQALRSI
ncbi:MAG: cobyric acid synthase CobQ, partial [Burkholderiaceae bacterium]|nr:cobyric acid synthase CobQ [Burkholderiaceae bacterium]